jgi:hypothetical protein
MFIQKSNQINPRPGNSHLIWTALLVYTSKSAGKILGAAYPVFFIGIYAIEKRLENIWGELRICYEKKLYF